MSRLETVQRSVRSAGKVATRGGTVMRAVVALDVCREAIKGCSRSEEQREELNVVHQGGR